MPESVNEIMILVSMACMLAVFALIIYRMLRNKYAKTRTVKAQVVDKFKEDRFTKIYSSVARRPRYYVVFLIDGKKKSFPVSEFSYGGYRLNERGTLKYKGDRIIDFG